MFQLSIITINFNNREGLSKTIDAVLSQKTKEVEFIVIDALSEDGSQELLKAKEKEFDQLVIEKDAGIYDGMNKGIRLAKGAYIVFVNSGDQICNLKSMLKVLEGGADCYYGNTEIAYSNGFERLDKSGEIKDLWKGLPFVHQSLIVRRELLEKNPFDLSYKYCSDYELVCRLYVQKAAFKKIDFTFSKVEAGGLSDERRVEATKEVAIVSDYFFQLTADQKAYFEERNRKGARAQKIKKILPPFLVRLGLRLKYRK